MAVFVPVFVYSCMHDIIPAHVDVCGYLKVCVCVRACRGFGFSWRIISSIPLLKMWLSSCLLASWTRVLLGSTWVVEGKYLVLLANCIGCYKYWPRGTRVEVTHVLIFSLLQEAIQH